MFLFVLMHNEFFTAIIILGLNVVENCEVLSVRSEKGKVNLVETSQGNVITDYFVNAAGFWARHIGQISNPLVKVPLYAAEHYYLHTKPIEGIDPMTPGIKLVNMK